MSKKEREGNRAARAAAIQREHAARERTRKILVVVAIVVVLGVIVAAGVLLSGGDKATPKQVAAPKAVASGSALVVGDNPDATVKVVIYEDFLCPYCREFEAASRTFLRADAEQGKVLVEYRPFHLLPDAYSTESLTAWAAILQNGTPKQALAFHDLLYENQPYEADPDKPGVKQMISWARKAGVKDGAVLDALGQDNPSFVSAAATAAQEANVQGTPTVIVNDKLLSGSPTDMADQVKALIAKG